MNPSLQEENELLLTQEGVWFTEFPHRFYELNRPPGFADVSGSLGSVLEAFQVGD